MESYLTLRDGTEAIGQFEDRRSRFIAQLVHVETEDDANAHIACVRARHHDARHNVPAWILSSGLERASDDGEPQRTSGMPSLEVLRGEGLADVCCVTTRYFGGTLLGPGGLVRAYTAATQAAVQDARTRGIVVEMTMVVPIKLRCAYADYQRVLDVAKRQGGHVAKTDYTDAVDLQLVFKASEEQAFLTKLRELLAGQEEVEVAHPCFAEF